MQRKFFRALFNTYGFFALYANIDGFDVKTAPVPMAKRTEMDRWVLSRLNSLLVQVQEAYDTYEPTQAARAIQDFVVEDLSNWYVRLNRRRFWKGEPLGSARGSDKLAAFQTLHRCLEVVAMLSAPIAPFFSDRLYRDLTGGSVHLSDWPKADKSLIDTVLEKRTALAQRLTSLVLSIRKKEGHRVRQPLRKMMVPALDDAMRSDLEAIRDLVLSEVNVKELVMLDPSESKLTKKIKPDFKKLGARLGKRMKSAAAAINGFDQDRIAELEREGRITLDLDDGPLEILLEEVEISADYVPGLSVASEGGLTVALDITLDDELFQEGMARELVSRIQTLRKESGLEVTDRIELHIQRNGGGPFEQAVKAHAGHILAETLALTAENQLLVLELDPAFGTPVEVDLEGAGKCLLALAKAVK